MANPKSSLCRRYLWFASTMVNGASNKDSSPARFQGLRWIQRTWFYRLYRIATSRTSSLIPCCVDKVIFQVFGAANTRAFDQFYRRPVDVYLLLTHQNKCHTPDKKGSWKFSFLHSGLGVKPREFHVINIKAYWRLRPYSRIWRPYGSCHGLSAFLKGQSADDNYHLSAKNSLEILPTRHLISDDRFLF